MFSFPAGLSCCAVSSLHVNECVCVCSCLLLLCSGAAITLQVHLVHCLTQWTGEPVLAGSFSGCFYVLYAPSFV